MRSRPVTPRLNRSVLLFGSLLCALASIALLLLMVPDLTRRW